MKPWALAFRVFIFLVGAVPAVHLHAAEKIPAPNKTCQTLYASVPAILLEDQLAAAIALGGRTSPEHLSVAMLDALKTTAGVKEIAELKNPATLLRIQRSLRRQIGNEVFDETVGSSVASARNALAMPSERSWNSQKFRDIADWLRGWGWKLLPDDDPAFQDPKYLASFLRESGPGGHVLNLKRGQASKKSWQAFSTAWRKIAPADIDPETIQFALTGTDANNSLYYLASRAYRARKKDSAANLKDVEILVLDGVYGGGGGRIGRVGLHNRDPQTQGLRVTSPHSKVWQPTDPAEIKRLIKLENQSLREIETKVLNDKPPVGALLLESILGAKGVFFYRPEYIAQLRDLADRLGIPIIADEILTGGGRTGKFFAYQHYPDFTPDYVTFGKGLQVSGVAQTDRGLKNFGAMPYRAATLKNYNEPLLKSAQILNRIHDDRLMENARATGEYLVKKLRAQYPIGKIAPTEEEKADVARGMGMLIYTKEELPSVRDVKGRLMPPMTLTEEDADHLLGPSIPRLDPHQHKVKYKEYSGVPVKLGDGSIIEGSVDHGGIQPNYVINLQTPTMQKFLAQAKEIGRTKVPFWEKANKIASLTRQASLSGPEYSSPAYLELVGAYRESGKNIPLDSYLEKTCGVCREQGMLLHLALEAAGFDSRYVYVKSFEEGKYVEEHAFALVKYKGDDWILDSRSGEYSGRRFKDATRPQGVQAQTDPAIPLKLPPYRFDPSDTRYEVAPFPKYWVPETQSP